MSSVCRAMGADVTMDRMRSDLPFDDRHRGEVQGASGEQGQSVVDFLAAGGILAEEEDEEAEDGPDIDEPDDDDEDDEDVTDG